MKERALVVLALALVAYAVVECHASDWGLYSEVGVGASYLPHDDPAGRDPLAMWRVRAEHKQGLVIEYEHQSSIPDGWPINDNLDQRWHERVGIFYRWKW